LAEARQAEVGDQRATALGDQHVVRFEIAVNQPRLMRGGQPAPGVEEEADDLPPTPSSREEPLAERLSLHQIHGDEDAVAVRSDVVDGDHVRMRQTRHCLRLAQHAGARAASSTPRCGRNSLMATRLSRSGSRAT
jgi:hypothetical protein